MEDVVLPFIAEGGDYSGLALSFNAPFSHLTILVDLLLVGLGALAYWWWRLGALPPRRRGLLIALRTGALLTVLFLLFDPVLVARRLEPGRHFVLLLFDDSQSMQIPTASGRTRGQLLRDAFPPFAKALRRSHQVALFRFGAEVERLRHPVELDFSGRRSDLVGAIDRALRKMGGATVSAVVLLSDGVQQTDAPPNFDALPAGVPVFTVGTGADSIWHALEIAGLSVERTAFDRSPVALRAQIRSAGFAGAEAQLEVLDGTRPVAATAFALGSAAQSVRLEFVPDRQGFITYTARVRLTAPGAAAKDPIAANDTRAFLVDNRARTYRILYFGGRPSWDHKFVRRALDADPELALSSLVRVSGAERRFVFRGQNTSLANPLFEGFEADEAPRYDEAVFLRLGLAADELAEGYPRSENELFPFDLVVWSDIERGFFSQTQLELTRDFVTRRGGSLLLSGPPAMLGEGGYARSLVEGMLPAALRPTAGSTAAFQVQPTIEGQLAGVFSLAADPDASRALWDGLPPLYGLARLVGLRAGATVLARTADRHPLFAWQRFGEGTTALLATSTSWRWQLLSEERAHPRFWRQLARALVRSAPAPVLLDPGDEALAVGDRTQLAFIVRDSLYHRRESLSTLVALKGPDGHSTRPAVTESLAEAGLYAVDFAPKQPGLYTIDLQARDIQGAPVAELTEAVLVHPDHREFTDARANPAFLAQLAERSGGTHYPLDRLAELPAQIPVTDVESQRTDRFHLWHWPPFYALIALLWGSEWYLRRRQGQP